MTDILVTGANGFIGQKLIENLKHSDYSVYGAGSSNGDISLPETWEQFPATSVFDRSRVFRSLNKFFLARVRAAIISGPSHSVIFEGIIPNERLITIPNFAQDFMFCDPELVKCKFSGQSHLRIVYVSGMTEGKGYMRLLRSYESLDPEVKARIIVDFAGKFESTVEKELFLLRIQGLPSVTYHGVVDDSTKAILHANSHVFCLPTSFMEGQPISILEAYASGCVVVTPPRPGILDIFHPDVNVYLSFIVTRLSNKCR